MVLPVVCVLCVCATLLWCAWLWRPLPVVPAPPLPPSPPETVHGPTPELGKWLRENNVQAARFNRGDLIEVVMRDTPADDGSVERGDGESDSERSDMDKALELLANNRDRRRGAEA